MTEESKSSYGEADVHYCRRCDDLIVNETNHRVANSLQLVSSLVRLQSLAAIDPSVKAELKTTHSRIDAISSVHRLLSNGSSSAAVPLKTYLAELIDSLGDTLSTTIAPRVVTLRGPDILVHAESAMGIGMIINELVTNACKYAYRNTEAGMVRVIFDAGPTGFSLAVEDDGAGLKSSQPSCGSGLGSRMVVAMSQRLGGTFRYAPGPVGVRALVTAPDFKWRPAPDIP